MTVLSVNVNKIAWLRNARNNDQPNLIECCQKIIAIGAQSITVHPRPDQRHIRTQDVYDLADLLKNTSGVEFNIEGNPTEKPDSGSGYPGFSELVKDVKPTQITLVPDASDQLTSDHGWDLSDPEIHSYMKRMVNDFQEWGSRVSIFLDPVQKQLELAHSTGAARIELYTGPWVELVNKYGLTHERSQKHLAKYKRVADRAHELGMQVNAGHDVNLQNLEIFCTSVAVDEISIGQALIADALTMGLANTVSAYLSVLEYVG